MNPSEVKKLLRFLSGIDGRKITRDTESAWYSMFSGYRYTYPEVMEATRTVIRNADGKYVELSDILAVLRNSTNYNQQDERRCEHGLPPHIACRDCEDGNFGAPHEGQKEDLDSFTDGTRHWQEHVNAPESHAIAKAARAQGVVYPNERSCPDGHAFDVELSVSRDNGSWICGHCA